MIANLSVGRIATKLSASKAARDDRAAASVTAPVFNESYKPS